MKYRISLSLVRDYEIKADSLNSALTQAVTWFFSESIVDTVDWEVIPDDAEKSLKKK